MPTALEVYVEQLGIMGALTHLGFKISKELNLSRKEFFINCRNILTTNRGGKIKEANNRFVMAQEALLAKMTN